MKKTKTIEINVCDVCKKETSFIYKCPTCDKEICIDCKMDLYKGEPIHNWGEPYLGSNYGCGHKNIATMCSDCFNKLLKHLKSENKS
jgi:hypothetical protein